MDRVLLERLRSVKTQEEFLEEVNVLARLGKLTGELVYWLMDQKGLRRKQVDGQWIYYAEG